MKKKFKILLSIIVLVVLILVAIIILKNRKPENILQDTYVSDEVENLIDSTQEISIEADTIESSNSIIEETIHESEKQESTTQVLINKSEEVNKSSTKKNSSSSKTKIQTKDEPNNNVIVNPIEETTKSIEKVENTNINESKETDKTTDTITKPTIKKISQEEYNAEVQKYLKDIQAIKPGLKYIKAKRGQVFWPYRTSEIESAVGGVSFGIVYYYVDIFVEGNEEKFKYYIDWAGNK